MNDVLNSSRPRMVAEGFALFVTDAVPPLPGGSSVLNQNFLRMFEPGSFKVLTRHHRGVGLVPETSIRVTRIGFDYPRLGRINKLVTKLQQPLLDWAVFKSLKRCRPAYVIGAYPEIPMYAAALKAAKMLGIPFAAYLHDTLAEANEGLPTENIARKLWSDTLAYANPIFVMSDGMALLFEQKYKKKVCVLRHTYAEAIHRPSEVRPVKTIFWGGSIYGINSRTLSRLSRAIAALGVRLTIATSQSRHVLERLGINLSSCDVSFFASREEYLRAMRAADLLLLALDESEETTMHKDEISTIFPTKSCEYFASGVPVLAICPQDYFLHRFIKQQDCGFVFDQSCISRLGEVLKQVEDADERHRKLAMAGESVRQLFAPNKILECFWNGMENRI